MPNLTFYVREEDFALFERARALCGERQWSQFLAAAVRQYVLEKEGAGVAIAEHVIKIGTWPLAGGGGGSIKQVRFSGWLLASGEYYFTRYVLYQVRGGKILVYWHYHRQAPDEDTYADYALLDALPSPDDWITGKLGKVEKVPLALLQKAEKSLSHAPENLEVD